MKDSKKYKVIIHTCRECQHEWFEKKEGYFCPECKGVYLAIERR